jgi:Gas vesicle protein
MRSAVAVGGSGSAAVDRAALADQSGRAFPAERIALVDLLDRVLAGGVVIAGEVTLSIADVDMVTVSLRALISSVSTLAEAGIDLGGEFGGRGR